MSVFYCHTCDKLRDADDGCEEAPNGTDLICIECVMEAEAEAEADLEAAARAMGAAE